MLTIVTTSWDDGDPLDLRIAEMLQQRNLWGSFYIPILGYDGRPTMGPDSLRVLAAQGYELGAHGVSHHTLPKFRAKELTREVRMCKTHLQDILGEEVQMFCYPKGRYSARVIREVKKAGYAGARTTEMLGLHLNFDPYRMSTTLQVYPHTKTQYLRNIGRALHLGRALDFAAYLRRARGWVQLAKMTFQSPSLRYLRWPYHAKVMKMLEIVSNKIVRIFRGASFLVAAWMPGFGAKIAFEISMASLAYRV